MKRIAAFFDDDSGRFEVITGTIGALFCTFTAGVTFMQREWLDAAFFAALGLAYYRWATTYIALRAHREARKHR